MTKSKKLLSRRDLLRIMGLGVGTTARSACGVGPEVVETATATSVPATPTPTAIPTETPPPGPEVALRIAHISDGAISGNWWKGPMYDFPPGYMVVTLYTDGSSESEFVVY